MRVATASPMARQPSRLLHASSCTSATQQSTTMAAEEMASEDKQREYAAMREAAEKQLILTEDTAPRMRKTHKGDEVVDDENANDNTDFRAPQLRERETEEEGEGVRPHSPSH